MSPELSSMLAQIAVAILGVVLSAVGIVGAFVLERLRRKLGVERDSVLAQTVQTAIMKGLQAAAVDIKEHGTENLIPRAADYVLRAIPDTLAHFGITNPQLEDMVKARLPEMSAAPPVKIEATVKP